MLHSWVQPVTVSILHVTLLGAVCNSECATCYNPGIIFFSIFSVYYSFDCILYILLGIKIVNKNIRKQ